jgi:HTH-type transcriptional regulator / antitoxin HipB
MEGFMLIHFAKDLASYLRDQRQSQALTQRDVGILKQGTISEFESHTANSKIDTLFRILAATNVELHLIPKSGKPKNKKDEWGEE